MQFCHTYNLNHLKMKYLLIFVLLFSTNLVFGQDTAADSLLVDLLADEPVTPNSLLPEKMMFTQRMLWGQNGLYRKVGLAPKIITAESREKELHVRRNMFRIHQTVGLLTAAGMLAQGIIGTKLYNNKTDNYVNLRNTHRGLSKGINIAYVTTALMSFTSPPPMINRKKFDNIKLHKILSYVHLTGMITTNVLSRQINSSSDFAKTRKLHKYAGLTTFGAYALAIATIKFEF